jgi:hypothetical protein
MKGRLGLVVFVLLMGGPAELEWFSHMETEVEILDKSMKDEGF